MVSSPIRNFRAGFAKTRYQEWMEGAEERNKYRAQSIAAAARSMSTEKAEEFSMFA